MQQNNFHIDFRLNGRKFSSKEDLFGYTEKNLSEIHLFITEWFSPETTLTVQTSGSTGKPKRIQIEKQFMINSALATGDFFNLPSKTKALLCLSTKYIAGKMMLIRAMVLGWELDVTEVTSLPLRKGKKYDFVAMVPLQVQKSIADLHKAKITLVGGGAVSKNLLDKFKGIPSKIYQSYGMTETITHIAVRELHPDFSDFYTTLPNVKIKTDKRNCLVVYAPKVASETVITNDLVKIKDANRFMWLGRADNIINSGGIKLIPEQIEKKLQSVITKPFFITKTKDELLGEKVMLLIEGKTDENLIQNIKEAKILQPYEKPKEIIFTDKFIRTETDKINRLKTFSNFTKT